MCFSSSTRPGTVGVFYAQNGMDLDAELDPHQGTSSFKYISNPGVFSVEPSLGSVEGNTRLQIYGTNLFASRRWYCVFEGLRATKATFISKHLISCQTPSSTDLDAVTVALTLALFPASSSDLGNVSLPSTMAVTPQIASTMVTAYGSLKFRYIMPALVSSVQPALAFRGSKMNVTVLGNYLHEYDGGRVACVWIV